MSQNMLHLDNRSKSSFKKLKSSASQNRILENGKDITPLPFYPNERANASSMSLVQSFSSNNLNRSMLKSGMKSRKYSVADTISFSSALFSHFDELVPIHNVEVEKVVDNDPSTIFNDDKILLVVSPRFTIIDIKGFECNLENKPQFSKFIETDFQQNDKYTQFENSIQLVQDEMSSAEEEQEIDEISETASAAETEQSSVMSSHYSFSTARSARRYDNQELFTNLEKHHSHQMLNALGYLQKQVFTNTYFNDIDQFYKTYTQNCDDIKLLMTVKPLQYCGFCVSLNFSQINGLLFGLFIENSSSSYLVAWDIVEFFDPVFSQPSKIFHFDMEVNCINLDSKSNVIYCGSCGGTILVIAYDHENQSCELIFDSRLLFDTEMHGLTHMEISNLEETPTILVTNIKGQLISYKVAKRMSTSVTAFQDPNSSVFTISFCKFNQKIVLLASDGTISLVDADYTSQQCIPFITLPSFATVIKSSEDWIGVLTCNGILIASKDYKFKPVSPVLPLNDAISDFSFNPCNHNCCALVSKKGKVFIYILNQSTDECKDSYFLPDRCLSTVSFTNNGHLLLVGDEEGIFTIFTF